MTATQEGIKAFKNGDKAGAYRLFQQAVAQNSNDLYAWLGLAETSTSAEEKAAAYQQVLRRDANNVTAMKGLAKLVAQDEVAFQSRPQISIESKAPQQEQVIFSIRPSFMLMTLHSLITVTIILLLGAFGITRIDPFGFVAGAIRFTFGALILAAIVASIYGFVNFYFIRYTLTSRNLIIEAGILGKSRRTIPVQRIQDVTLNQSFLERLLNLGDIFVESAGGFGRIRMKDVADYQKRIKQLSQLIDEQQSTRGEPL